MSPLWSLILNVFTEVAKVNNSRIELPNNLFPVPITPTNNQLKGRQKF